MPTHSFPIQAQGLTTDRLDLEPLRVGHAIEMAPLLDDPDLHTFIGGSPVTVEELHDQYERQALGHSPDDSEDWLNWIVRRRDTAQAVGTVQATVTEQDGMWRADVAWVIASAHQGSGYAREAAAAMIDWLRQGGVQTIVAYVHPDHVASNAIARAVGLTATADVVDGEIRWQS